MDRKLAQLVQAGRTAEAAARCERQLRAHPRDAVLLALLGGLRLRLDQPAEALPLLRLALQLAPQDATARFNLALALLRQGATAAEAAEHFQAVLALQPTHHGALVNLAALHNRRGEFATAEPLLRRALAARADDPVALNNLGASLLGQGRTAEVAAPLRRAVALRPDYGSAWENLGTALLAEGMPTEAEPALARAVALETAPSGGLLGALLQEQMRQGIWRNAAVLLPRTLAAPAPPMEPLNALFHPLPAAVLLGVAQAMAQTVQARVAGVAAPARVAHPGTRLRLGYLSADMHEHATAYLVAEAPALHDRAGFAVHTFSTGADDGGAMRRRLVAGVEHFHDCAGLPPVALASAIAAQGLDLLIDLKGWTGGHKLEALALRPAPLQAHWLGFPGSMGADFLDYALVDATVAPPGCEADYTEKLVRLPQCYQPTDRQRQIAAAPSRAEAGLPDDALVLACFCQPQKIHPSVAALWWRLLAAVPRAVLWLLAGPAEASLRAAATAAGLAPERLIFAPRLPQDQHLARYALADLALDTWPYGSHTTASDALWMGCPQLALLGPHFPGRVSTSVVRAAGLPELVATTEAEYEALVLHLAQNPAALAAQRARVAGARQAPLFDTPRFTRTLEAACHAMVERHRAGLPPAHLDIA